MQSPTHPQLYIRNEHDAHVVMEAVRLGRLPMVTHRLSTHERLRYLQPGAVFVWEEAEAGTRGVGGKAMERWTDGLKWSPSRSNDPFLLYEEKAEQLTADELRDRGLDDPAATTFPYRRSNRPDKPDGLTKKTYSAYVHDPNAPPGTRPPKWHITSYFRRPFHKQLPTIDHFPMFKSIEVAPGTFKAAKTLRRRRRSIGSMEPEDIDDERSEMATSPVVTSPSTYRGASIEPPWSTSPVSSRQSPFTSPSSYSSQYYSGSGPQVSPTSPHAPYHPARPTSYTNGYPAPPRSPAPYPPLPRSPPPQHSGMQDRYLPPIDTVTYRLPPPGQPARQSATALPPFQELTRHLPPLAPPVLGPQQHRLPIPTSSMRTVAWEAQAAGAR